MNQNNIFKTVLGQTASLSFAIILSLLCIIIISNLIIFPIVLFSKNYPGVFTDIVKIGIAAIIIFISVYFLIYKIVLLRKSRIPFTITIKSTIINPLRYVFIFLFIIFVIVGLIFIISFILKTQYLLIYKIIY